MFAAPKGIGTAEAMPRQVGGEGLEPAPSRKECHRTEGRLVEGRREVVVARLVVRHVGGLRDGPLSRRPWDDGDAVARSPVQVRLRTMPAQGHALVLGEPVRNRGQLRCVLRLDPLPVIRRQRNENVVSGGGDRRLD